MLFLLVTLQKFFKPVFLTIKFCVGYQQYCIIVSKKDRCMHDIEYSQVTTHGRKADFVKLKSIFYKFYIYKYGNFFDQANQFAEAKNFKHILLFYTQKFNSG